MACGCRSRKNARRIEIYNKDKKARAYNKKIQSHVQRLRNKRRS